MSILLGADLQPPAGLRRRIIIHRHVIDAQRAASEGAAEKEARLGDERHVEDACRLPHLSGRLGEIGEKIVAGRIDPCVDLGAAGRTDAVAAGGQRQAGAGCGDKAPSCHFCHSAHPQLARFIGRAFARYRGRRAPCHQQRGWQDRDRQSPAHGAGSGALADAHAAVARHRMHLAAIVQHITDQPAQRRHFGPVKDIAAFAAGLNQPGLL